MALIKCPECGATVSDKAPTCVHCGYPFAANAAPNETVVSVEPELDSPIPPAEDIPAESVQDQLIDEPLSDAVGSETIPQSTDTMVPKSPDKPDAPVNPVAPPDSGVNLEKKKKKLLPLILIIAAALVAAAVTVYFLFIVPNGQIKSLQSLMDAGNWQEAVDYIKAVDNSKCSEHLSDCYYNLALSQMDAGEWEDALANLELSGLPSEKLIKECKDHIFADYEFQQVFEECIQYRMDDFPGGESVTEWCRIELERLEPFTKEEFNDPELKKLAKEYYNALKKQYNYLIDEDGFYDNEDWRDAYYRRITVINELIERFDFFPGNEQLRTDYKEYYEETPHYFEIEDIIEAMVYDELDERLYADGELLLERLENTTEYTFSVIISLYAYLEGEDEPLETEEEFPRVKPGSSFSIKFPVIPDDKQLDFWFVVVDVLDILD